MRSTTPYRQKKNNRQAAALPHTHLLVVEAFNERWSAYQRLLNKSIKSCAEADIHDLRVAARRLIAALDLLTAFFQHSCLMNVRRSLRDLLKKLNPLRDVQVKLEYSEKMQKRHPRLISFIAVLHVREKKTIKDISKYLHRKVRTFNDEKNEIDQKIEAVINDPLLRGPFTSAVMGTLAREYLNVVFLRQELSEHDIKTIHELRVAFKQFRYMMEIIQPSEIHGMKSLFVRMQEFQMSMGGIHDVEMLLFSLEAFQRTCSSKLRHELMEISEELERNHEALVRSFLESADDVYTFWKIKQA
jgi:CHAD domain-containing protein